MKTNYDEILPRGILFNLKELEAMKIMKVSMAKKMIYNGELDVVKIGNKLHVARDTIIAFLEANTIFAHEAHKYIH